MTALHSWSSKLTTEIAIVYPAMCLRREGLQGASLLLTTIYFLAVFSVKEVSAWNEVSKEKRTGMFAEVCDFTPVSNLEGRGTSQR